MLPYAVSVTLGMHEGCSRGTIANGLPGGSEIRGSSGMYAVGGVDGVRDVVDRNRIYGFVFMLTRVKMLTRVNLGGE
jgi:hypothetical protein